MPRPAKSLSVAVGARTNAEIESRNKAEASLRSGKKPVPPRHLTKDQKKHWKFIVDSLEKSGILDVLDTYVLELACSSIDIYQKCIKKVNEDFETLLDAQFRKVLEESKSTFFKCCQELCLSPQARAKMSIAMVQAESPAEQLKKILSDDEDEGE